MARGDGTTPSKRAPGAAIAAVSIVVCLGALTTVLWTTDALKRMFGPGGLFDPHGVGVVDPVPGAQAALRGLGWRSCPDGGGPTVGERSTIEPSWVHRRALARGYVAGPPSDTGGADGSPGGGAARGGAAGGRAAGADGRGEGPGVGSAEDAWSDPQRLPLEARFDAPGACGLLAVVAEPGATLQRAEPLPRPRGEDTSRAGSPSARPGGSLPEEACTPSFLLVAACDGDTIRVRGAGNARTRLYLAPGITIDTIRATGLPVDVALAHAEAAGQLERLGWTGEDEVVRDVPPASSLGTRRPPVMPKTGCTPFVVVGHGYGTGAVYWPSGGPSQSPATDRFMLGVLACASGARPLWYDGSFQYGHAGAPAGAALYFRAFRVGPTAGPAVPSPDAPPTLRVPARSVEVHDASDVPEVAVDSP
jgi:hypothetical protein